jgi:CheY-like chemotaxis protein
MTQERILLVEDSEPLRQVLSEKLRDAGYLVLEASGGDEGVRIAIEQKPDMVITDLVMFPTDGIEMTKTIRASGDWGQHVKVIALTNQNQNEELDRIKLAEFTDYVVKAETGLDEVVTKVKQLLKGKGK